VSQADENAAFYCPNDDTIYFSEDLAARLWRGVARDFPGEQAGYGHAVVNDSMYATPASMRSSRDR